MANFAEAIVKFTAESSGLNKALADIEKSVKDTTGRLVEGMKTAMVGLAAGIAAATATVAALTKVSADAGDELMKMSQRVAISVETLSGYKLAADLAGISLEELGKALQRGSKNLVDAATGSGAMAQALQTLGVSVFDAGGKLKSIDQVMLDVADKFSTMPDGAQKTAYAIEIFGKSGAALIPLLNQGSAAIAAQRLEARQLGATWTTAQAQIAEQFHDNLERIEAGLAGFRNAVAGYLMPFINEFLDRAIAKIKEWGADGTLKIWALQTAEAIVGAFVGAAQAVASVARAAPLILDSFRGITVGLQVLRSGFDALIGYLLQGLQVMVNAAAAVANTLHLGGAASLNESKIILAGWIQSWKDGAQQAADSSATWGAAIGTNNAAAEQFASSLETMAKTFEEWAGKAMMVGTQAAAGIGKAGEAAKKTGEEVQETLEYQVNGVTKYMTVWKKAAETVPPIMQGGAGALAQGAAGQLSAGPAATPTPPVDIELLKFLAQGGPAEQQLYQQLKPVYVREQALAATAAGGGEAAGPAIADLGTTMAPGLTNAETAFEASMTKMEERSKVAFSNISQNMYAGVEEWFVKKLTAQAARS